MNADYEMAKLKVIARLRGGDCLSKEYHGVDKTRIWGQVNGAGEWCAMRFILSSAAEARERRCSVG